jgi:hypothetical protein
LARESIIRRELADAVATRVRETIVTVIAPSEDWLVGLDADRVALAERLEALRDPLAVMEERWRPVAKEAGDDPAANEAP